MTTLLARVLLTLAFLAIAFAETCTLCPNGEKPDNGNTVVYQYGTDPQTCTELAKQIIADSVTNCGTVVFHAYQVVCGCPKVKAGSCPGICNTGFTLAKPDLGTDLGSLTCSVVDQILRGKPGDTSCDTGLANGGIKNICACNVKGNPGQNMGGGAGNPGTGMKGMSGGRQLRLGGLEERFPPRAARGLAM